MLTLPVPFSIPHFYLAHNLLETPSLSLVCLLFRTITPAAEFCLVVGGHIQYHSTPSSGSRYLNSKERLQPAQKPLTTSHPHSRPHALSAR